MAQLFTINMSIVMMFSCCIVLVFSAPSSVQNEDPFAFMFLSSTEENNDDNDTYKVNVDSARKCGDGSFACLTGDCIPLSYLCDSDEDCPGGEDEKNCSVSTTTELSTELPTTTQTYFQLPEDFSSGDGQDCDDEDGCKDSTPSITFRGRNTDQRANHSCSLHAHCAWNRRCNRPENKCQDDVPFNFSRPTINDDGDIYPDHTCLTGDDCATGRNCSASNYCHFHSYFTCNEATQYPCKSGRCISKEYLCDNDRDCPNGDDEDNCPTMTTPTTTTQTSTTTCNEITQYQCKSGRCIPKEYVCDNDRDCFGGDDEDNCPTTITTTTTPSQNSRDSDANPNHSCNVDADCAWNRACSGYGWCHTIPNLQTRPTTPSTTTTTSQPRITQITQDALCDVNSGYFQCFTGECISPNSLCDDKRDCQLFGEDEMCVKLHYSTLQKIHYTFRHKILGNGIGLNYGNKTVIIENQAKNSTALYPK